MKRIRYSFDLGTKELRIFEDCTLQEIVDACKDYETDLTQIKIKTQLFPEPVYTETYFQTK